MMPATCYQNCCRESSQLADPFPGCESIRQKIIKLPRKVWCTCINMTIHKISHRVSWIHTISYLHGNLTRKKSPNFQKTSHNLQAPFFNQTKQPRFPPGITWSHHVLREFRGRWFEYRLTGIAGACRRSHWYVGEVPVGGGKGKVRATGDVATRTSWQNISYFFENCM